MFDLVEFYRLYITRSLKITVTLQFSENFLCPFKTVGYHIWLISIETISYVLGFYYFVILFYEISTFAVYD